MKRSSMIALGRLLITLLMDTAWATSQNETLEAVNFRQHIGEPLPAEVGFMNADGETVSLRALADDRPMVLIMSWYDCPHLCPMVLDHLATAATALPFSSNRYQVAVVSIDPEETPTRAREVHSTLKARHGDIVRDWQLLTGEPTAILQLAQVVGFEYVYDAERDRYAHPAGLVVVNPGGQIGRYLLGIRPEPTDLKLALVEAGQGKLGTTVDQLVLRCYQFNPETGRYNFAVVGTLQWVGGGFALALGGLVFWLYRRERLWP